MISTVDYGRYGKCYRLANDNVELLVTAEVGPRIIRFGFIGQGNEFAELPPPTATGQWDAYGGHRLWHAPESKERSYQVDDQPVQVSLLPTAAGLHMVQPVETRTGIEKQLIVELDQRRGHVRVTHELTNRGVWPVELSVWALSAMQGGTAIIPQPPFVPHQESLRPVRRMALWSYTDMADPRWTWGREFILLRHERGGTPQKLGVDNLAGWLGWQQNDHLFLKRFAPHPGSEHPDLGCNVEVFTDADMLELETLSPLVTLAPGETAIHTEHWFLYAHVATVGESALAAVLEPYLQETLAVGH